MRYFTILFFVFSLTGFAQDSTKVSPQIIAKVKIGQSIAVENLEIHFVNVMSDSRCPKEVKCVWAGQAEICLSVKKGSETQQKNVIIGATSSASGILIAESENKEVYLKTLKPYPQTTSKIPDTEYYLEILVLEATKD